MKKFVTCQCCGKIYSTKRLGTDMCTICPNCSWEQDPFIKSIYDNSFANASISILQARYNIIRSKNIWNLKLKFYQHKAKLYTDLIAKVV